MDDDIFIVIGKVGIVAALVEARKKREEAQKAIVIAEGPSDTEEIICAPERDRGKMRRD